MLPCQRSCSAYWTGCHKTCSRWKDFHRQSSSFNGLQKSGICNTTICAAHRRPDSF